jgi:hypothetical protein
LRRRLPDLTTHTPAAVTIAALFNWSEHMDNDESVDRYQKRMDAILAEYKLGIDEINKRYEKQAIEEIDKMARSIVNKCLAAFAVLLAIIAAAIKCS